MNKSYLRMILCSFYNSVRHGALDGYLLRKLGSSPRSLMYAFAGIAYSKLVRPFGPLFQDVSSKDIDYRSSLYFGSSSYFLVWFLTCFYTEVTLLWRNRGGVCNFSKARAQSRLDEAVLWYCNVEHVFVNPCSEVTQKKRQKRPRLDWAWLRLLSRKMACCFIISVESWSRSFQREERYAHEGDLSIGVFSALQQVRYKFTLCRNQTSVQLPPPIAWWIERRGWKIEEMSQHWIQPSIPEMLLVM